MTLHNRERGTVVVEAGGRSYQLVLDLNALVRVEGHFSTPDRPVTMIEISRHITRGSVTHTLALVWAALQRHHPELTMADAGDIIWAGGMVQFRQHVDALMQAMQADPADLEALGVDQAARPPQAPPDDSKPASKRTTGGASTSRHVVAG
jgi:hypothetical protein